MNYKWSYDVSSFLPFHLSCSNDGDSDCILSHVVQYPDVTDGVRDQGVYAHDEIEEQELKNIT